MKRTISDAGRKAEAQLREHALGYPETREDHPWGHVAIKVREKVFVFLGGGEGGGLSLSVKLAASHTSALDRPFAEPTGYGLGKHGWVSATFEADETPPLELLRAWIDESYRAIAPKKLVAALAGASTPEPGRAAVRSPARTAKQDAPARASTAAARKKAPERKKAPPREQAAARARSKDRAPTAGRKRARG